MAKTNLKVVKINPELDDVRNLFNLELSKQLGRDRFPKIESDLILANVIRQDLMNFKVVKFDKKFYGFDIKWK